MGELISLKGKINNEFLTNIPDKLVIYSKITLLLYYNFLKALDVKSTPAFFGIK